MFIPGITSQGSLDTYLANPDVDDKEKIETLKRKLEQIEFHMNYMDSPREKYQSFLLQAKQVDTPYIDELILEEVKRMKTELER